MANQASSPEEMRKWLQESHPACYGWAMHCCDRRREDALEALQTAYQWILEGRAVFRGEGSWQAWTFGVIRNAARRRRRSVFTWEFRHLSLDQALPLTAQDPAPEEDYSVLAAQLKRLSTRQRDVLHLVFYEEMTIDESARVLGISPGSARRHYERAKERLRKLLPRPHHEYQPALG